MREQRETESFGWRTTKSTRGKLLLEYKEALNLKELTIYSKPAVQEHFHFVVPKRNPERPVALSGKHDDYIFSMAMAYQILDLVEEDTVKKNKSFQMYDPKAFSGGLYGGLSSYSGGSNEPTGKMRD